MVMDYRRAIAGAFVTVGAFALAQAGVELPAGVGEAILTLIVFGLGFIPNKKSE